MAAVLLVLAFRVYLGRFERLFADHTIFTGVTYTIRARDAAHIATLFADLKDIPGVLMVL